MKVNQRILAVLCGVALSAGTATMAGAQVVVRMGPPPPPVMEHPGRPPHRGWVWVPGHHRWDGRRYVWVRGYYARPPRPNAVWVPGRWDHRGGGYVWVDGRWR